MAVHYVRSSASGAGDGSSWTNAYTTLAAALSAGAAGDTYYLSEDHAESQASALTLTFKGTASAPDQVICVNHNGSVPPVAADVQTSPAGSITTTGNSGVTIGGGTIYFTMSGLTINVGSGANNPSFSFNGANWRADNCAIALKGTTGGNIVLQQTNSGSPGSAKWNNVTVSFGATNSQILNRSVEFVWKNTASAIQGATLPTSLFGSSTSLLAASFLDGVDLSALGSGKTLVGAAGQTHLLQLTNCKLGASVTVAATPTAPEGTQIDLINCDSGATGYRQERYRYQGTLTTETTVVRSGGASDDVQAISHKIVTTANASRQSPFDGFEIAVWSDAPGAHSATVELITDNVVLTNADVWAEVSYLGSSATPIASIASSAPATILTSGSNLTTSSATWATTGLTTPKPQSLTVNFTTAMKGLIRIKVKVAKASTTLRIDPYPTIA